MKLTAPSFITATCVSCAATKTFELTNGSRDDGYAEYRCEECDHLIRLDLSP